MPTRQKFEYRNKNGGPVVPFNEWLQTLSADDQQQYAEAQSRQLAMRQGYINRGILILDRTTNGREDYVWRDADAAKNGKPMDEVWGIYWRRYLKETGTVLEIIEVEE